MFQQQIKPSSKPYDLPIYILVLLFFFPQKYLNYKQNTKKTLFSLSCICISAISKGKLGSSFITSLGNLLKINLLSIFLSSKSKLI